MLKKQLAQLVFAATAIVLAFVAAARADGIEFQKNLDEARSANKDAQPIVVQFTATWCGWCRKMEGDTFADATVQAIAGDYLWVAVDIDQQPELAARFRTDGVPHTVVLDKLGRVLGSHGGYLPAKEFLAFLEESRKNPHPEELVEDLVQRFLKAGRPEEQNETGARMVEQLARPSRFGRDEFLAAFEQKGESAWPMLLELMGDKRLSIRAAAAGALRRATKAELPFHPFAKPEQRDRQIVAWRSWVDANISEATP